MVKVIDERPVSQAKIDRMLDDGGGGEEEEGGGDEDDEEEEDEGTSDLQPAFVWAQAGA